jgi:dTDP-4-dehydrorhamnose reductase
MERLLIIGCSGLLGSRLREMAKGTFEVFGTYNSHEVEADNTFKLDVTNREGTFRLIDKLKPDCVVDTHAMNNLDYCETHIDETWRVNVDGTRNVAEACKNFGSKYIFLSTDYVFDGKKLRYTEKDKPHPLNYYAKTKLVAECMLSALDMNYIVARTSVMYGMGGMNKVSFVAWLISKLGNKEGVRIVNDQRNNPTLADNLAEFLLRLYQKDEGGLFHITGKECLSRYDFALEIARTFGLNKSLITPITTPELNQIAKRPESVSMSAEKAERVANMKALDVKEGLQILKKQMAE